MFTRELRLLGFIIIVGDSPSGQIRMNLLGHLPSRGESRQLTVQSRHASEDSRRIAPVFLDLRAVVCSDFRPGLYLLRRASRAYLVRSNRRRGSGAHLLEKCASCELG